MHPMAFVQKRAHLSAVARGREMFEDVQDMTPARFDVLYLIHEQRLEVVSRVRVNAMEQARIPHMLGLRRQTVWKMVERLVELGLVRKTKDEHGPDPRRNILSLTAEGIRRVREAYGVAFSERLPLPKEAPTEGEVPRYWRRPELADVRRDFLGEPILPKKVGREVAKIYTSFAWKCVASKEPNQRHRYLAYLDDLIMTGMDLAEALGDTSTMIYPVREPYFTGPPKGVRERERRLDDGSSHRWCEVRVIKLPGARVLPLLDIAPTGPRCRPRRPPHRYRKCKRLPDTVAMPIAVPAARVAIPA